LKLKVAARIGDFNLLAKAMRSYPKAKDLNEIFFVAFYVFMALES
jgi:hypothetical protein